MVQASQMIDTSGGSTGGGGTFDGIFKLNGIIILKPTQPIDWNKKASLINSTKRKLAHRY